MDVVNIEASFAGIAQPWTPMIAGELNGQYVKLAVARGAYIWHQHEEEDELFLVTRGILDIHVRDGSGNESVRSVSAGELTVIPRGVEHKPVAREGDVWFVLFEPKATRSTGDMDDERTIEPEDLKRLEP